jgi:hypothetical protein
MYPKLHSWSRHGYKPGLRSELLNLESKSLACPDSGLEWVRRESERARMGDPVVLRVAQSTLPLLGRGKAPSPPRQRQGTYWRAFDGDQVLLPVIEIAGFTTST